MDKKKVEKAIKTFAHVKDKPDMVDSDNISLFDLHEDMRTVDAIPVEELNNKVLAEGDELLEEMYRDASPKNSE